MMRSASLFAELFNAVLFGGRSYIKMEDINSLPDFPTYLMRSSRFGVDLFLLDFTAIVSNYDLWLLSSSLIRQKVFSCYCVGSLRQ